MPNIAFIDDGINPKSIPKNIQYECLEADSQKVYPDIYDYDKNTEIISHGTQCYQIFHHNICSNVHSLEHSPYKLTSIKVLDNITQRGSPKALYTALKWCADNNIHLINMSMGTEQYSDFADIAKAVSDLPKTIVVAACNNKNQLTFPACLPSVIGVRYSNEPKFNGKFAYLEESYDNIEVITSIKNVFDVFDIFNIFENIENTGKNISDKSAFELFNTISFENLSLPNSFAAPLISARICNYLSNSLADIHDIRNRLKKDSIKDTKFIDYNFYKSLFFDWEEVNIPIVAISTNNTKHFDFSNITGIDSKIKSLLAEFISNGYRAVCLTTKQESSIVEFIYNIEKSYFKQTSIQDIVSLYVNFTLPDILFLQFDYKDIVNLTDNMKAKVSIMLASSDTNCKKVIAEHILDFNTSNLYECIVELLS